MSNDCTVYGELSLIFQICFDSSTNTSIGPCELLTSESVDTGSKKYSHTLGPAEPSWYLYCCSNGA